MPLIDIHAARGTFAAKTELTKADCVRLLRLSHASWEAIELD